MSSVMYALFNDPRMAEQVRARLLAIGIKRRAIQVLSLMAEERGHMGGYADTEMHMHDAERDHVGSYADSEMHMHDAERDHVGSYADTEMHMHDAERDHVGSFASHMHSDDIMREIERAGIANGDAQDILMRMGQGAALLLVQPTPEQAMMVTEILRG